MSLQCTIIIEKPVAQTVSLYLDPKFFGQWQKSFQSYEPLLGERYSQSSTARLVYLNGERRIELTETILSNNLPNKLDVFYDHEHMSNKLLTRFEPLPGNRTQIMYEPYDIHFKRLLPKILSPFIKGKFRKEAQKWLDNFKSFAERNDRN